MVISAKTNTIKITVTSYILLIFSLAEDITFVAKLMFIAFSGSPHTSAFGTKFYCSWSMSKLCYAVNYAPVNRSNKIGMRINELNRLKAKVVKNIAGTVFFSECLRSQQR